MAARCGFLPANERQPVVLVFHRAAQTEHNQRNSAVITISLLILSYIRVQQAPLVDCYIPGVHTLGVCVLNTVCVCVCVKPILYVCMCVRPTLCVGLRQA